MKSRENSVGSWLIKLLPLLPVLPIRRECSRTSTLRDIVGADDIDDDTMFGPSKVTRDWKRLPPRFWAIDGSPELSWWTSRDDWTPVDGLECLSSVSRCVSLYVFWVTLPLPLPMPNDDDDDGKFVRDGKSFPVVTLNVCVGFVVKPLL